jgi:hypothetical protein
MTFLAFFGKKHDFAVTFYHFEVLLAQKLIKITLLLVWSGPRNPKNVFMWPAKPRINLMRPISQFEFETLGLDYDRMPTHNLLVVSLLP